MKLSNGLLSFILTVTCYIIFFICASFAPGNESSNQLIAAAATVAMTFFVNFPVVWFIVFAIIREIRRRPDQSGD